MGTPPPTPAHPTPPPPHLHLHTSTCTPPPAPAHLHLPNLQATPETCTCTHLASPAMDIRDKNEFIYFMQRACENQSNDCYIELYNILLRAFVTADVDFDGKVSEQEFGGMISAAAALPKKFGFDWWQGSLLTCSRPSMRTAMVPSPLTSGSASPTRTTRARKICLLPLTSRTRTNLLPIARSP